MLSVNMVIVIALTREGGHWRGHKFLLLPLFALFQFFVQKSRRCQNADKVDQTRLAKTDLCFWQNSLIFVVCCDFSF